MPQRDPLRTLAKLRQLLDQLDTDLGEQSADSADAGSDEEERYIAARVEAQLAKLHAKSASSPARRHKGF